MKYALYARVSKRTGQTVENQIPVLEEWAKIKNVEYDLFTEQESTRKTRPVREHIIQSIRAGTYKGIVCVRLDRFLRSLSEVNLIKELVDKGVEFYFIQQGLELTIDKNNAMANMQLGMLSVFAEFERELIRERTLEGLERAKTGGKQLGRRKGSKDKGPRRKAGYWLRFANKKVKDNYYNKQTPLNNNPEINQEETSPST